MATSRDSEGRECSSSDVFYDNICQPCKDEGNILEAEGRCEDCDEFLCKPCFLAHTVPRQTRHHVLIRGDQGGNGGTATRKDQCTQRCTQHDDEIIKYYCPTDKVLGCNACMILDHTSCTGKVYIPDVAKDMLNSEEYRKYKTSKSTIESKTQAIVDDAEERINTANDNHSAAVEEFRKIKDKMIDLFEKAENDLVEESKKIKEEEVMKQTTIKETSAVVEKEMRTLTSSVERFESRKQYCNMYAELMKIKEDMLSFEQKVDGIDHRNDPRRSVHFSPNHCLVDELSANNGIGTIKKDITEVKHDKDINVKTHDDKKPCFISGSAMLPGNKLIIVDCNNEKLKLVDIARNKVVEELFMSSYPWDVTKTSSSEVAVALLGKKIGFVKTGGNLVKDRAFVVDGDCRGVSYNDGKLLVTFDNPPKVVMMDMQGTVLQTIATNKIQNDLLTEPLFIASSPVNKAIYVANASARNVVQLDTSGILLSTYTDSDLKLPVGMAVDSLGMVYVCDWDGNSIHQITKDCKKRMILLTQTDVTQPYTISFSDMEDRLYVGMRDSNVIRVFKVVF